MAVLSCFQVPEGRAQNLTMASSEQPTEFYAGDLYPEPR